MSLLPAVLMQRHRGAPPVIRGITTRYVRFLFNAAWSVKQANDGYMDVQRVRFYGLGAFMPYTGIETASDSGHYNNRNASFTFANGAPTGNSEDTWTSGGGGVANTWIAIDFGEVRSFEAFGMSCDGWSDFKRAPGDFELQTSIDGSAWTTVKRYRGHDWRLASSFQMFYTDDVPFQLYGRFWRAYITNNQGAGNYGTIVELSMAAVAGGADQCTGGTASSSGDANGSNPASAAFDNNPIDKWTSDHQPVESNPAWVQYDFGQPVGVAEILMQGCISGQETYAPKDVFFQVSDNNVAFRTAGTFRSEPTWTGGEVRTYSLLQAYSVDTFETDSTANYDYIGDTPGTWSISGGRITWSGSVGGQALAMPKEKVIANGWLEVLSNELQDGGLVARVQDNGHYLLDVFADPYYTQGYYKSGSDFNSIGSKAIGSMHAPLARGMNNMCRMELVGNRMYSWVNGWLEGAWDAPTHAPDKLGLRASNTPVSYNEFRYYLVTP